jgi:hypothetical protein
MPVKTIRCTFRGFGLAAGITPNGKISCGVDGWLIGNVDTAFQAENEFAEYIRLANSGIRNRVIVLPSRFCQQLRQLAEIAAS